MRPSRSPNDTLVQIMRTGHDVYIGDQDRITWIRLSGEAFRALVLNGRSALSRACSQPGSIFAVTDAADSATIVLIGNQIHIGSANIIRYVHLTEDAILAIFNCGLHALAESASHNEDWVPLSTEHARAASAA